MFLEPVSYHNPMLVGFMACQLLLGYLKLKLGFSFFVFNGINGIMGYLMPKLSF